MDTEQRMAGDYRIIHDLYVGDKKIVVGESTVDTGEKYMCAFCEENDAFAVYTDVIASDDYLEIITVFGERIAEQASMAQEAAEKARAPEIDDTPITAAKCDVITYKDNIEGKVIVIKPDVLRPEYRFATHQLKLCVGGFGAHENSRGSACFCVDLRSGNQSRFERGDILGTMDEKALPDWAKQGLEKARQEEKQKRPPVREER